MRSSQLLSLELEGTVQSSRSHPPFTDEEVSHPRGSSCCGLVSVVRSLGSLVRDAANLLDTALPCQRKQEDCYA